MKTIRLLIILTAAAAIAQTGCIRDKVKKETKMYTVTVTSTDGGTAKAEPQKATEGTKITLSAEADAGYLFQKWTVVSGEPTLESKTANPATFTMPAENVAIRAEFVEDIDVFTKITDDIFREYCRQFDTDGDSKLSIKEAWEIKEIEIYYKGIRSLAGIEYFTSLETLGGNGNPLNSIDVSKNTELTMLLCAQCGLETLDLSQNKELLALSFSDNSLGSIDLSANTKLLEIGCSSNLLTALDLSQNTALTFLDCSLNLLQELDVTNMTFKEDGIYTLHCGLQKLTPGGTQGETIMVTMREDMKDYWNSTLKDNPLNRGAVLVD